MDKERRDLRRAAAQAFLESLNNLEETLHVSEVPVAASSGDTNQRPSASRSELTEQPPIKRAKPAPLSLEDLEQAVADIEQYMQTRQSNHSESL